MKKLFIILAALGLTLTLAACKTEDPQDDVNTKPVLAGVANTSINVGDAFNASTGVTANDEEDDNITSDIVISGTVDVNTPGTYTLTYSITDDAGETVTATRVITVVDVDVALVYPTGFFNYKFAAPELRLDFMAAAEKYLMNNMAAGIPLFASGTFNLYSSRLQLPVDSFIAVMGYGTSFATMSADDSTVLMDDGEYGNVGEYTYRTTISTNPGTFNQWLYDTSTDSDLMADYYDALYTYVFNADKSGYAVVPSMASGAPIPIDSTTTDSGKLVSKTWQIPLRDDLVWKYHPDTDISNLPSGHEVIDANDFVDTFKLALDLAWFRAISGGGDFLSSTNAIFNAQEYLDGSADWDDVGLSVVDGNVEFKFINDMSDWNIRYFLSSFVMTPINVELFNEFEANIEGEETNPYGTSEVTVAYHGSYYVDYFEADKVLRYIENDLFHSPDLYFFTGKTYAVIEDSAVAFQEFNAGKLEGAIVPTAEFETYENHPGLKKVPGATTYRIMINGLGTREAQLEQFPDSAWIPEPILALENFKMAMYHAIDRQVLAEDVLKTRTSNMFLFSDAYLVDAELGVPYRLTPQGESVKEGLSPSTFGFNADAAHAYFLLAIDTLIANDDIEAGTTDAWTEIHIEMNNYSNSDSWDLALEWIKTAYEGNFQDDERFVKVTFSIHPKPFPGMYYDFMMVGEFDVSVGGISGSTLDAASFLDTYSSDDRGGFTLNWGIDTSVAEIQVQYTYLGVAKNEMWSFDAISSVLNGEIYLLEGEEAEVPAATNFVWTPSTIEFEIDLFADDRYENITYSVQVWDDVTNAGYTDLAVELTGVTPSKAVVSVAGLIPGGDYQVSVYFDYVSDDSKVGVSVAPWFYMPDAWSMFDRVDDKGTTSTDDDVDLDDKVSDFDAASFGIVIDDDFDGTLVGAFLMDTDYEYLVAGTDYVVNFTDLEDIRFTGLVYETSYIVELEFTGDVYSYVSLSTLSPMELADPVYSDYYTLLSLELHEDLEGEVISAVVYDSDDDVVVGAAVNVDNLDLILVTGLLATDDYYVEFTVDGMMKSVAIEAQDVPDPEIIVIDTADVTTTLDFAIIDLTLNADYVAADYSVGYSVVLNVVTYTLDDDDELVEVLTPAVGMVYVVNYIDNLIITGLDENTEYALVVTYGDITLPETVYFMTEVAAVFSVDEVTLETATLSVVNHDAFAANLVSATVAGGTVVYADLDAILVTGLYGQTEYTVVFTYSDFSTREVVIMTSDFAELTETEVLATTATFALDIDLDGTTAYDTAVVTVAGGTIVVADGVVTVTGLTAETEYTVVVTFAGGLVIELDFETTAVVPTYVSPFTIEYSDAV